MKWLDRFAERVFTSPLLWGGLVSVIFHTLLGRSQAWLPPWLVERLTGQWESYVCTTMFLIARSLGSFSSTKARAPMFCRPIAFSMPAAVS